MPTSAPVKSVCTACLVLGADRRADLRGRPFGIGCRRPLCGGQQYGRQTTAALTSGGLTGNSAGMRHPLLSRSAQSCPLSSKFCVVLDRFGLSLEAFRRGTQVLFSAAPIPNRIKETAVQIKLAAVFSCVAKLYPISNLRAHPTAVR